MKKVHLRIPIYLPEWLYPSLKSIKDRFVSPPPQKKVAHNAGINLIGDRDIEWSWIAARIPAGPGRALDFGPGESYLGLIAEQRGFEVLAVDRQEIRRPYSVPRLKDLQGDLLKMGFRPGTFDVIINCSTVEHVGLSGRYGETNDREDGDLEAMRLLSRWLKPKGLMLLTIPVGLDAVFSPLCRVYGCQRLPRLLEEFTVREESFWTKEKNNRWISCSQKKALSTETYAGSWNPGENFYAMGFFVLEGCRPKRRIAVRKRNR